MTPVSEQVFGRHISGAVAGDGGSPGGQLESSKDSTSLIGRRLEGVCVLNARLFCFGIRLYDYDGTTLPTQSPDHGKVITH